jgi:subtilisin family serine protease
MDPALQELTLRGAPGDEIAVIIRLRDPGRSPPEVRIISRFGDIVTARVPRAAIPAVWSHDTTASVKAPRAYAAELESWEASPDPEALRSVRRPASLRETGRGVVIGAADWGCDVRHPDFRHPDGRTRLLALWDQRQAPPGLAEPFGYGRIHDASAIDAALRTSDPYAALGHHPADFDPGAGAHGTHTLSIAAGNGLGGGPVGMAPEADLVFVNMGRLVTTRGTTPLGDSIELLEAIDFIRRTAAGRPCVINLSLGRHAGEHTGRTLVELAMDQLLTSTPGLAVVQSCGNYARQRTHASWQLRPGEVHRFVIEIDPADTTVNELDIWYKGRDTITVELATADGSTRRLVRRGEHAEITVGGRDVVRAYHREYDPNNGDHQCSIFIEPGLVERDWEIALVAEDIVDGRVHAWIERDSGCFRCQSRFEEGDADPLTTTGTIANGFRTISVGAYDQHRIDKPRATFSSVGPTRDGRDKPDLVGPGVLVPGARSTSRDTPSPSSYVRMSGTSMAAPAVTGTVALMFQGAGRPLRIEETRRLLLAGCDKPNGNTDRHGLGSGYLNPERTLRGLRPAPVPKEAAMTADTHAPNAVELFEAYAGSRQKGPFEVVGAPGEPLQALRPGDLVVVRPPGLPIAYVSVLAGSTLRGQEEIRGRLPGLYAAVVGVPAHTSAAHVADPTGVVPPHTVLLRQRALQPDAEAEDGIWVPGAEVLAHTRSGGLPYVASAPWRFVFHTIEARPSADGFRALARRHANPPHLWAMPSADLLLQVIPLNRGAYALAHPRGTVHTNRMRAIQVECWGYARDMGTVSTDVLDWLADRVLAPVACLVPINLSNARPTGGEECYGRQSACRMTDAEWRAFNGVCGHQHVPHNSHWDPGRLDLGHISARAAQAQLPTAPLQEAVGIADKMVDNVEAEDDAAIHSKTVEPDESIRGQAPWVERIDLTGTPS